MKYQDERKETPFSARDYMLDIWDHTLELCFRNFGKKKRKPPKEPSNFAEWSPESRDRWTAQQQEKLAMAEAFDATFIQNETRVLDALCRKIVFAIDAANTMPTIYVCECEAVRLKQTLRRMRQKLKRLAKRVANGLTRLVRVEEMFRSWIANYSPLMSKKQKENLVTLYQNLFGGGLDIWMKERSIA